MTCLAVRAYDLSVIGFVRPYKVGGGEGVTLHTQKESC